MKKKTKPATVKDMKFAIEDMEKDGLITDARILVYLHNREYVVTRIGHFHVMPNMTLRIELNKDGQL